MSHLTSAIKLNPTEQLWEIILLSTSIVETQTEKQNIFGEVQQSGTDITEFLTRIVDAVVHKPPFSIIQ